MLSGIARNSINPVAYAQAEPFPHTVIDHFLDVTVADHLAAELKNLADDRAEWGRFPEMDTHEDQLLKRGIADYDKMTPLMRLASAYFSSSTFLAYLQAWTGIPQLIADPAYTGGGYHQTSRRGKLGIHHDFNVHAVDGQSVFRRINLLIYMNSEWESEWGGQLELWQPDLSACAKVVEPLFNRAVIFTIDDAPHGHPHAINCPEGETRRSLAYYYYTTAEPLTERRLLRAYWKYGNQLL